MQRFNGLIYILLCFFVYSCYEVQFFVFAYVLEVNGEAKLAALPEESSGWYNKERFVSKEFMVVSAHPLATKAGYDIINMGGNAIDAMIAVQLVLNLVEPQSSGIGGGAFLLYYDSYSQRLTSYDGRETAPRRATETLFYNKTTSQPKSFTEALVGGSSVGVPGLLKLMEHVHSKHGQLPWSVLFQPAIRLCLVGFPIGHRLAFLIKTNPDLKKDPDSRDHFYHKEDGSPKKEGETLHNYKLAQVLRDISVRGVDAAFYTGELASKIVNKIRSHPTNPGDMQLDDLKNYQIKTTTPLCRDYQSYEICSTPPESGGIVLLQILGILDRLPQDKRIENELPNNVSFGAFNDFQPSEYQPTPRAMHLFAEACKLAFADRNRYLAEMDLNWDLLLDSDYLTTRASLIKDISMGQAPAGSFSRDQLLVNKSESGDQPPHEFPCTSHISIVDRDGNAISLTTSIEHEFGSSIMVEGFLLNNQLTDFNFIYYDDNTQCSFANKVRPNKRPRSSMSPTLIFKKYNDNNNRSQLVMSIGAAGGPLIPMVLGKSIIATLNWGISLQDSFNMVNFGSDNRFGLSAVEIGHLNQTFLTQLEQQFGQKIFQFGSPTGMQGFTYDTKSKTYIGASDPRKEGSAMGD